MKKLLGDHEITIRFFDGVDSILKELKKSHKERISDRVGRALLDLIEKEPEPCFLLPAVLEFVRRVDEEGVIVHYSFNQFEGWLNHYSGLDFEANFRVRGKIAGKKVERGDYQVLFPIGTGKVYEGTHFVTAHKSPDLDTTIASFWGWLDAFAAKVGDGLHVWNVPDGPPASQIEIDWIFRDLFGSAVFTHLPKTRTLLNLTGTDLICQKGLQKKGISDSIAEIDHERDSQAILVVDDEGHFLGDWRATDVEGVRQVIILLSSCLRWFESRLNLNLVGAFAREKLRLKDVEVVLNELLQTQVAHCQPALEFSEKQKKQVGHFVEMVLEIKGGLNATFEKLAKALSHLSGVAFGGAHDLVSRMQTKGLFDQKGHLVDDRSKIFSFLEEVFRALPLGIIKVRSRMEKLDIALKTKVEVFGHHPTTVTPRADVEEIRNKMGHYSYLTVVDHDHKKTVPLGVIHASNIRKSILGTVSLRDFCNRDEMGIPPYLEVISVIDHHKTTLNTFSAPMAILSDAQSSNTLVAQKAFEINDINQKKPYYIDKTREYIEYLHFLYGIIDDTDLLSKVSPLDVQCVAQLLNRMKSLVMGKKTTLIDLSHFPRDKDFPKKSAEIILQNEDMYSLYSKIYEYREKEVEKNIDLCVKNEPSNLFADTKEQNGCCRIGQTKMFVANIPFFKKHVDDVRRVWLNKAMKVHKEKPEIDLHIHMTSTIVSAEEVYKGTKGKYSHQDEVWIWIPEVDLAVEHLKRFLNGFQASPGLKNNPMEVEFLGKNGEELASIFEESFTKIPQKKIKGDLPIAVLKIKPASLNSRKAMVSPFLPTLNS